MKNYHAPEILTKTRHINYAWIPLINFPERSSKIFDMKIVNVCDSQGTTQMSRKIEIIA